MLEPPPLGQSAVSGEEALIAALLDGAIVPDAPSGPGDDCAVIEPSLVVTTDILVQGVHFDQRLAPEDVGYKAVAVNVSDIAAMGARPEWMVLQVCMPLQMMTPAWSEGLSRGLALASKRWCVPLVGGDTTRGDGALVIGVTMGGRPVARPILRSTAAPGDDLWVTGTPGLAGAGYVLATPPPSSIAALRRPNPPVALATGLAARELVSAMMDLSDGLQADLPRLCSASGVGAVLWFDRLPIHPDIVGLEEQARLQLTAGDDYELLFTSPAAARQEVAALADGLGIAVTRIGCIDDSQQVILRGRAWPAPAFSHFPTPTAGT